MGDVFVTKMYLTAMGDYEMHNRIVVYEPHRCIGWEPSLPGVDPANADRPGTGRAGLSTSPPMDVVTETYNCSDSPEQVRRAVDNGNAWLESMTKTRERLDQLCAKK